MGQWEENGQLLAYVRRKDKNNLECFVGATDEFGQIHLSESGSNCQRNLKVIQSGMRLSKAGEFLNIRVTYLRTVYSSSTVICNYFSQVTATAYLTITLNLGEFTVPKNLVTP